MSATKRQRVEDDEEQVQEETEDDKQFENTFRGKVMASIEAKQKYKGVSASAVLMAQTLNFFWSSENRGMWHYSVPRTTAVHVSFAFVLYFWPSDKLHYRYEISVFSVDVD